MFYEVKNLLTSIVVAAYEMQILAKDAEIIKRLKQKMEGRCMMEYGYIIKILTDNYRISEPVVEEDGCRVEIRFSAITFKRTGLSNHS
jgi:DNA-directed RNA polymerase subunit E'/Rpb7